MSMVKELVAQMPPLNSIHNFLPPFPTLPRIATAAAVASVCMLAFSMSDPKNKTIKRVFHDLTYSSMCVYISTGILTVLAIALKRWPISPRVEGLVAPSVLLLTPFFAKAIQKRVASEDQILMLSGVINLANAGTLLYKGFSGLGVARLVVISVLPILQTLV